MSRKLNAHVASESVRLVNVDEARAEYDPELPDANAVLAAIACVSVRYAANPSLNLAVLAADLSFKLTAEAYAESLLVSDIACHLVRHWNVIVHRYQDAYDLEMAANSTHH